MKLDPTSLMREAIRLARENIALGRGGPFGAVVARDGAIVATGVNQVIPRADPTAHAEMEAIRAACAALGTHDLRGLEIYSSCEPCPMCLAAIHWARLDRVSYGCDRAAAARAGFDDAHLYEELRRKTSARRIPAERLLADEAAAVLAEWAAKKDKVPY